MPHDPGPEPGPAPTFLDRLGVRRLDGGGLELIVAERHLRTLGIAHGGVIATLLDSAMGLHANRSSPPDHYLVTAQLNVHFIRPAFDGETVRATSRVHHVGRKTAVADGEVRTAAGALIATASATFVFVPHDARTRARPDRLEPEPADG